MKRNTKKSDLFVLTHKKYLLLQSKSNNIKYTYD